MVYKPFPDGSVERVGTSSTDGGKNWQLDYDFTYRRSTKAAVSEQLAIGYQ